MLVSTCPLGRLQMGGISLIARDIWKDLLQLWFLFSLWALPISKVEEQYVGPRLLRAKEQMRWCSEPVLDCLSHLVGNTLSNFSSCTHKLCLHFTTLFTFNCNWYWFCSSPVCSQYRVEPKMSLFYMKSTTPSILQQILQKLMRKWFLSVRNLFGVWVKHLNKPRLQIWGFNLDHVDDGSPRSRLPAICALMLWNQKVANQSSIHCKIQHHPQSGGSDLISLDLIHLPVNLLQWTLVGV